MKKNFLSFVALVLVSVICFEVGNFAASDFSINEKLMKAIQDNKIEEVRELISQGANINIQYEEWENKTPLVISIEEGNDDITNLLLDNDAKVNYTLREENFFKTTALHEAVIGGKYDIVKRLVDKGTNIDEKSKGNTALYYAIKEGHDDIAILLIESGADYNRKCYEINGTELKKGITPFELAIKQGNESVVDVILKKEEEKNKEKQELRDTYIRELKDETRNRYKDKAYEAYIDLKTGTVVDLGELDNDEFDDLLLLYGYGKMSLIKQKDENEITQEEILEKLEAKEPIYIKVLKNVITNNKEKHNETVAAKNMRKFLREEGETTLTKIKGTKTGKLRQCFSMINYGKITPFVTSDTDDVGIGVIQDDIKRIYVASEVDIESSYHKKSNTISASKEYYNSEYRDRENINVDEKINSILKKLEEQQEVSEHNEIIMDVQDKDIKFIFWTDRGDCNETKKLKALYLQKKYKELSGRTLPIYRYKPGAEDYLQETNFTAEEVIDLLREELIDVDKKEIRSTYNELARLYVLITLKDEISQIEGSEEIIDKFIENEITKYFVVQNDEEQYNVYDIINLARYIGMIQGKDAQKNFIEKSFGHIDSDIEKFLDKNISEKDVGTYKEVALAVEVMSEIRHLEAYEEVKEFLEPQLKNFQVR